MPTEKRDEVYFYNLKELLASSKDFNPSIVQKKNIQVSEKVPVSLHRYITGKEFKKN